MLPIDAVELKRLVFAAPRDLLRDVKHLAADRDVGAADLVRAWIAAGLAGEFDHEPLRALHYREAPRQFPVNVAPALHDAIFARSRELDLSVSQLLRRWIALGWEREVGRAN